jgi:hypothetical protein
MGKRIAIELSNTEKKENPIRYAGCYEKIYGRPDRKR